MSDLISRADAIEAVRKIVPYVIDKDTGQWGILVNKANVITELSALPSADAEWIPCSERMPSEDGRYLVCMNWEYENMEVLRWADGWNCHRGYDGKISRESEIDGTDILAWMPLPTPLLSELRGKNGG